MGGDIDQSTMMQKPLLHRPRSPGLGPWLAYFHGSRGRTQTFFSMAEGTYEVKKIIEMRRKIMCTCSYGWLVLVDELTDSDNCFLLNPISMQKIQLPAWKSFSFAYCVLSLPPNEPECVVMFFEVKRGNIGLMFCKPGDLDWTKQELELHHEVHGSGYDSMRTVGVHNGEIYILTACEKLLLLNVDQDSHVTQKDLEVDKFQLNNIGNSDINVFLVELCGGLFRVDQEFMDKKKMETKIQVHKLDFKKNAWMRLTRMNDHAIFLNSFGRIISCSTKESGIPGNTIYFTLPEDRSLYEYDLETGSVAVTLPCPNVKNEWCEPQWILPYI